MLSGELLIQYEAMRDHSLLMLEAARKSDWESLIALERERTSISSALQEQEQQSTWAAADQIKKANLIRAVLANDEETRRLVEPRRQELQNIFGSLYAEKKLQKAYSMAW